jgi:hypothetical protein
MADSWFSRPLEILHRPLMLFGRGAARKGSQVPSPPSLGNFLSRIQPVFSGFEFANHVSEMLFHAIPSLRKLHREFTLI